MTIFEFYILFPRWGKVVPRRRTICFNLHIKLFSKIQQLCSVVAGMSKCGSEPLGCSKSKPVADLCTHGVDTRADR